MAQPVCNQALVTAACPHCGSTAATRLATELGFGIQRCDRCMLTFVSPRLREHQHHYYGQRETILRKYGPVLGGGRPFNRDRNYRQELALLARLRPTGRLLDVGTHCGFFLRLARGMSWELHGVEPSPAAEIAREFFGLDVRRAYLEEAAFPAESFDVITLIDLIEHEEAPHALLAELRRILKPDGLIFIKTPNARYNLFKYRLLHRVLGLQQIEIFDAKEHVVQYTRQTLGRVLQASGLEIIHELVPYPIQDGAAWKCALRWVAYLLARAHFSLSGGDFGPFATDLAVVVRGAA